MTSFEQIYEVPRGHSLVLLKYSTDRHAPREEWLHEERDAGGRLIARYASWDDAAERTSGFCKYDAHGRLVRKGGHLPVSSGGP